MFQARTWGPTRFGWVVAFIVVATAGAPLVAQVDCTTQTDVPQAECEALVSLFNATAGASWEDSSNWLSATMGPCSWFGVQCDAIRRSKN